MNINKYKTAWNKWNEQFKPLYAGGWLSDEDIKRRIVSLLYLLVSITLSMFWFLIEREDK